MPQIREYESKVSNPGAINYAPVSPDSFGAAVGRGAEDLGQGLGAAAQVLQKRANQNDLLSGFQKNSELLSKYAVEAKARAGKLTVDSTPEEISNLTPQLLEDYKKEAEQASDGFDTTVGKSHWAKLMAETTHSLTMESMHQQAEVAGTLSSAKVVSAAQQTSATLERLPSKESFLSSLAVAKETLDKSVSHGDFPGADGVAKAAKLFADIKSTYATSTIRGMIANDAPGTKAALERGDFDKDYGLDGEAKLQLIGHADMTIRANNSADEQKNRLAKEALEKQQDVTRGQFLNQLMGGKDESGKALPPLDRDSILNSNLPNVGLGSKDWFINQMSDAGKKAAEDNSQFTNLFTQVHQGKITNSKDLTSWVGHGLSWSGYKDLEGEIQGKNTPEGEMESRAKLDLESMGKKGLDRSDPLIGIVDREGPQRTGYWNQYVISQYQKLKAQGKSSAQIYDSLSQDFEKFRPTSAELLEGNVKAIQGMNKGAEQHPLESLRQKVLGAEIAQGVNKTEAPPPPKEGQTSTSNSGKPIVFKNGKWVYQ